MPSGFVRKASTSNLLSLEMNVNDSTSAICLSPSSRRVEVRQLPCRVRPQTAPADRRASRTRRRSCPSRAENDPTVPRSLTTDLGARRRSTGNAIQPHAAALLHGEQHARCRPASTAARPDGCRSRAPSVAPVRAVGVHHPHMRVLHRRLAIGEAALGRLKRDRLAVGRPLPGDTRCSSVALRRRIDLSASFSA